MIAAVVLAAGLSKRMGRPKQTVLIGGEPMLQRVLREVRKSQVDRTVVVLGAAREEVEKRVAFKDEIVVVNTRYRLGLSSSLKKGLAAAGPEAEAALVVLGDQPYVSSATIDRLVNAYRSSSAMIVAPAYRGRRGNPVLFDRRLFPQIMKVRGDRGAKAVVERNAGDLLEVEVEDGGVILDLDTPQDLHVGDVKSTRRSRTRR